MQLTFVGTTGDEDLCLNVEAPAEVCVVVFLKSLAETESALWVGIMVCGHRSQSLFARFCDPGGWGEVHVPLAKIDAIRREIHGTVTKKKRQGIRTTTQTGAHETGTNL